MPNAVEYKGRTVNVGTIPIGIDPEKFTDVATIFDVAHPRRSKNPK
jgi:trehalose-6-phosphate synthase